MQIDYDPYSDEAMLDPQRLYALLRQHDSVHYLEQYNAWAVATFDDVWQVCSDTINFSVRGGQTPNQVLLGEPAANLTFPELDPPEHRLRRRVLAPSYTRDAAEVDDTMIQEIVRLTIAPLVTSGGFDAFEQYASTVSSRVAARKAGLDDDDVEPIRVLLHEALAREPQQRGTSAANAAAMGQVFGYLTEVIARCRADRSLAAGMLGVLLDASVDGRSLTDPEIAAELHTLLVTGSETVEHGTVAALYYLANHPDQKLALLGEPTLSSGAFAESIRFHHPTDMLCRTVINDVVVGSKQMRAGQGVLLLWASANRDEREFDRADEFNIRRKPARSLAFGHGQHKCIGEHIAMRMGTILIREFADAVSDFAIDCDGIGRRRGEFLKGFNAMPVTVTPRSVS